MDYLEEALAKIKVLEGEKTTLEASNTSIKDELTKSEAMVKTVQDEAAESRISKQTERKQNYILNDIIKKNNITFDMSKENLQGITFDDKGQVIGDVAYQPNTTPAKTNVLAGDGTPNTMTVESIQGMNRADIAKNWDAIAETLANQPNQPTQTI